ncbi:hypothetical protein ABIA96_006496 [Bradyrhizobium sp. LB11.1]
MVQVEHRKRFAGEDHLVVVQPDGTLALIPAWMSEDMLHARRFIERFAKSLLDLNLRVGLSPYGFRSFHTRYCSRNFASIATNWP